MRRIPIAEWFLLLEILFRHIGMIKCFDTKAIWPRKQNVLKGIGSKINKINSPISLPYDWRLFICSFRNLGTMSDIPIKRNICDQQKCIFIINDIISSKQQRMGGEFSTREGVYSDHILHPDISEGFDKYVYCLFSTLLPITTLLLLRRLKVRGTKR